MALGMVILVATLQWYHVLKISNFSEKNKKESLDIARTVFQFIRQDVQSGGYCGCRTRDHNFPLRRNFSETAMPHKFLKRDRAVFGFQSTVGVCQQHMPEKFCGHVKENTDVLIVYNIPQKINKLKHAMANADEAILIQEGGRIRKNAMVLISDAEQGDFFIANDVKNEKIFHQLGENTTRLFSKCYAQGTEVTELQTVAYYLSDYSLFRSDIRQKAEEIVQGVVNFSIEYGVLGSKGLQYYAAASIQPEQWGSVCMVRLKIETKGEVHNGVVQKNHTFEYAFAIRNRHRVNTGIGAAHSHFIACPS